MKRSDMIMRIANYLNPGQNYSPIQLAEAILKECEKAGMLPGNVIWLATGDVGPASELAELASSDNDASIQWEDE